MEEKLQAYFQAEKTEAFWFIVVGILGIIVGLYCWLFLSVSFWKGAVYPLVIVGTIQLVVGCSVYFRTDRQAHHLLGVLKHTPEKLIETEMPRMSAVNKNFEIYKYIEIILLFAGLVMAIWAFVVHPHHYFLMGLGVALLAESSGMLALDFIAESRANVYTAQLLELDRSLYIDKLNRK